jgi:phosphoribosylanthranilate isomerase
MSILVKFCGFTKANDVVLAITKKVDYIGFIIENPKSLRSLNLHTIGRLFEEISSKLNGISVKSKMVAVVEDLPKFKILQIVESGFFDVIQFHGQETPDFLADFYARIQVWKVFSLEAGKDPSWSQKLHDYRHVVHRFLLDKPKHKKGSFNAIEEFRQFQKLDYENGLAGGLNEENISAYISELYPDLVDVCSGIEEIPGVKSEVKMDRFLYLAGK